MVIANASANAIEAETGSSSSSSSSSSSNDGGGGGGGGGGDVMANSNGAPRKRKHLVESVVRGASLAVQYDEAGNRQVDGSNKFHGTSSKQEHGGATATQTRLSPLPVASAEVFAAYAQTSSKERSFVAHPNLRPPLLIQVVSPATLAALIRRNCPLLALRPAVRRRRGSRAPPILATVVKASSH